MIVLGLTGSLATGKTTVAAMFAEEGAAVFDADEAVHDLYRGAAVAVIEAAFPGTTRDGAVDRTLLGRSIAGDQVALARLEAIVHPLVRAAEDAFRVGAAKEGRRIAIVDVPLLLEGGGGARVGAVVVTTTAASIQRARIVKRGMAEATAVRLLARQMPDAEKRKLAHFIIDTSATLDGTRRQVHDVIRALAGRTAA